ncbi:MAG: phosphatidate cytidylyltransferase [Acutalibacteraceae bacterium]|nr:phosphatidate cytidylyltransferase [Acutalibacteraceae bacterium]
MKTRIISGVVMALIVAAFLTLGIVVSPLFIIVFIAAITAVAIYELLHNAAGIKSKAALIGACAYSVLNVFALDSNIIDLINEYVLNIKPWHSMSPVSRFELSAALSIIFFIFVAVVTLKEHKQFTLTHIVTLTAMPIAVSFAFSSLSSVLSHENGIFYLLMLLNFSSVCDMGAYFVGSSLGKHKLCPEISPKKTVEGAVGGVLSSIVVSLILVFAFSVTEKLAAALILTVPFCILGMIGDLFASAIKRTAGIKDYGNLIPGHGGILDRFDSIIMIAPLFSLFVSLGVI